MPPTTEPSFAATLERAPIGFRDVVLTSFWAYIP